MVPKPPVNAVKKPAVQRLAVDKLRVKNPNSVTENPCLTIMSAVLGCWASQGQAAANCLALEQSLRGCMDTKVCGDAREMLRSWTYFEPGRPKNEEQSDQPPPRPILQKFPRSDKA